MSNAITSLAAPIQANETLRARFENSLVLLDLYGTTESGEAYAISVSRSSSRGAFRVQWNVQTLEKAACYRTARMAYWRSPWTCSIKSEAKAADFVAAKIATLRAWAAKRGETVAA